MTKRPLRSIRARHVSGGPGFETFVVKVQILRYELIAKFRQLDFAASGGAKEAAEGFARVLGEVLAELALPWRRDIGTRIGTRSFSKRSRLPVGVSIESTTKYRAAVSAWTDIGGRLRREKFSFGRYGRAGAIRLAAQARRVGTAELRDKVGACEQAVAAALAELCARCVGEAVCRRLKSVKQSRR